MPTIPYNTSVQRTALPSLRRTETGVDTRTDVIEAQQKADFGRALTSAGQTFGAIVQKEQEHRNLSLIAKAETQLGEEILNFENSAKERQGWNAEGLYKDTTDWWDKAASRHMDSLENDAQRRTFSQIVQQKRLGSLSRMSQHQRAQLSSATESTLKASIGNAINDAASNAGDPESVDTALQEIERKSYALASYNGWDAEQRGAFLGQQRTTAHKKVIETLIQSDAEIAKEYYDIHEDEIDGVARPAILKQLETGTLREKSQRAADGIMGMGLSETEALKRARKDYEGDLRDEVVRRVSNQYSDAKNALHQDRLEAGSEAYKIIAEGGTYDDLPPALLNRLDGKTQLALKSTAAKQEGGARYWELREMAEINPQAFAQHNLYGDFGDLAQSEREELAKMWFKARKGPAPSDIVTGRSKWQIVQQGAAHAGLNPKEANEDNSAGERLRQYYRRVDDEIAQWQFDNGKKPGAREIEDIVNRLAIKVTEEQSFLGLDYLNPDDVTPAGRLDVPGVPTELIDELAYGVQEAGQPVTVENIKKLYGYRYGTPPAQ